MPIGTMAQVAQSTFSDHIRREDLPSFLLPVIDNQSSAVGRDKMLLGVLNVVSGILPPSIYGVYDRRTVYPQLYNIIWDGYATSKGELEVVKHLVIPIKNELRAIFDSQKYFYDALPEKGEFKTSDAIAIANESNIAERTAKRMLGEMVTLYNVLSHPRHGVYAKALASNNQEVDSDSQTYGLAPVYNIVSNPKPNTYDND